MRCRSVQRILKVASTYARALQKGRVLIVQSGGPGYETVRMSMQNLKHNDFNLY